MRDSPPEWERGFYMAKKREKFGWEAAVREFRWSFVVAALAFVALGLVLILWPRPPGSTAHAYWRQAKG